MIVTGAGDRAFAAGAGISQLRDYTARTGLDGRMSRAALRDPCDRRADPRQGTLAIRLAKLVIRTGMDVGQQTGLIVERLAQALLYTTSDKREGAEAVLAKRTPRFAGRWQ